MSNDLLMVNRRLALTRISALALAAYIAPTLLTIGRAQADDGDGGDGGGDGGDGGGDGSGDGGGDGGDDGGDDGSDDHSGKDDDSKKARDAVRSGNAASLGEVMGIVRKKYKGEVVRVRLTGSGKNLTYNIRIIDQQSRLVEIRINAVSRRILSAKVV